MEHYPIDNFRGRLATLVGLGTRTHVSLARYLVGQGARVRISEMKSHEQLATEIALIRDLPVEIRTGGHRDEDVVDADIVFVSPAVPRDLPILKVARQLNIPISSEIELLFALCRAPIVGITGSAGKTTTTTLVGEMLRADGRTVLVGGNIGVPLIDRVDEISSDSWVVLELSSYQLEALRQSAHIGAVLNVTPNHLDRHPSFEHYRESKFNLLRFQRRDDVAVLSADDHVAASLAPRCQARVRWFSLRSEIPDGAFRRQEDLVIRGGGAEETFARVSELKLPGEHNVLNVLAAAALANSAGASVPAIRHVATTFAGVEHRLEFVRALDGVAYYNDSIATAPERTIAALRALTCPIILIAGGRSKHLPMEDLASTIVQKVRALILIGEMADEIEQAVRAQTPATALAFERASDLIEAVRIARRLARTGDAVLLSPSGTSFDQFQDFEDRGRQYKAAVHALEAEAS